MNSTVLGQFLATHVGEKSKLAWRASTMSVIQEYALADCVRGLVRFVDGQASSGAEYELAPSFSSLLPPKQCDDVDRVCDENGWLRLNRYAVMLGPSDIRHVLDARKQKDGLMCPEIEELLAKAYSPRSLVRCNPPGGSDAAPRRSGQQSVMLNTHQKLYIGGTPYYATAIMEIRVSGSRRYLAPVTCYHVTEAKKRKMLK